MNHENDWSQPNNDWASSSPEPGHQPPATQAPSNHPLGNNQFDFGAFLEVVRFTFETAKGTPVLKAVVGLALVYLALSLVQGFFQAGAQMTGDGIGMLFGLASMAVGLLTMGVGVAVAAFQYSLYQPLTEAMSGRAVPQSEPMALIKASMGRVFMVGVASLLLSVGTGIGMMMCLVPGVIFGFLFCQAPYLVASRDEELISAFTRSMERAKKHWHLVVMSFALTLGAVFVVAIPAGLMIGVAGFIPVVGPILGAAGGWLIQTGFFLFSFVVTAAAFATIDELEGERQLAR